MKRVGERGEGRWQRLTWDQAATEIADKVIDLYQKHGPGALLSTAGSGMQQTDMRWNASFRFTSLIGGIQKDITSYVGDLPTGVNLAYGDSWLIGFSSDSWFDADYILLSGCNPNVTRIPDAHFIWEAKYNGCRVVSMAPDYNPSSIHADLWLPVKQGTDPFVMMSLVHVVIKEQLVDWRFVKEQTDLPLLVRQDNQRLLRQSDLEANGSDEVFYFWDHRTQRAVPAPGSMGSADKTIALGDIEPALEGSYQVNGIAVQPAYESVRREALRFSPESTAAVTGIDPEFLYQEARRIAAASNVKILGGFAITKYANGIYTQWSQVLLLALTGHSGANGGIDHIGVGWLRPAREMLGAVKPTRVETGGLGEWLLGEHAQDARDYFDAGKLKQHLGYDIDDLQDMIDECLNKGWMPHWGKPKGMIVWGDNFLCRNKAARHYRKRILSQTAELYVNINTRMDSSALWADYLLPAASHYEAWDLRSFGYHRFVNAFTAPAAPVGESRPDWDITALLCQKIQERAKARGIGQFDDPAFGISRDFDTLYDDFTMNGRLRTDHDACQWLLEQSPEHDERTLDDAARNGFLIMNDEAIGGHYTRSQDNMAIPFGKQVFDKEPYPTLSGRITFYIDHDWFLKLGAQVPTARRHAGRECSKYPLGFYSPHTRWGIHSNWRSNKYMMRLQRGEPYIYLNPGLARRRGIADGERVRVFNSLGEFYAQAKFYPSLPEDAVMMEHAWETYQFEGGKGLNDVSVPLLQPLEMVGNWGHLKFDHFDWSPNQLAHESGVDIENAAG
jgi:dimethylsulfide dehydrogenase subunit alpha/complex iron-sulfur molybdoenzyme family reductase subunit alpha